MYILYSVCITCSGYVLLYLPTTCIRLSAHPLLAEIPQIKFIFYKKYLLSNIIILVNGIYKMRHYVITLLMAVLLGTILQVSSRLYQFRD